MFNLIKQVLIVLLSLVNAKTIKLPWLNYVLCMIRPIHIDLNPIEPKYYQFLISLDKCSRSCNVLSPKVCVPKETKNINVKGFNIITNKNEAEIKAKHISCDWKCKFNSTRCNSNKKWNNKTFQCECKIYHKSKKIIVGILGHVFVRTASM